MSRSAHGYRWLLPRRGTGQHCVRVTEQSWLHENPAQHLYICATMPKQSQTKHAARGAHHHQAATERRIQNICKFHSAGSQSLTKDGSRMGYRSLKSSGTSMSQQETQRKARAFAKAYPPKGLNKLMAQCRQAQSGLSISHVNRLVSVHDETERKELQEAAIENNWSVAQLNVELCRRFGSRRREAGRRPLPLRDSKDIRPRIARFAEKWKRFREEMALLPDQGARSTHHFMDQLLAADKAFEEMAAVINRKFKTVGKSKAALASKTRTPKTRS